MRDARKRKCEVDRKLGRREGSGNVVKKDTVQVLHRVRLCRETRLDLESAEDMDLGKQCRHP